MLLKLEIYKNKELVNTITSDDDKEIYKQIAQVYFAQQHKRATKTTDDYLNNTLKITQVFDASKTQLDNTECTYKYTIENISL